ncbi:DNA methylase [bacterium]|nr:DNA methylase [bacterium]
MPARKAVEGQAKTNAYSDIDLNNWKDYPEVETGSLWLFSKRDKGETHVGDYHGNFIPQLPQQLLKRYTKQGEVVLDLFNGMGTTLIECRRMGRHGIGVELLGHVAEAAEARIQGAQNPDGVETQVLVGDSAAASTVDRVREALTRFDKKHADLAILHPPYGDIISFSNGERPEDLSNVETDDEFIARFEPVIANAFELLAPGRFMALVIGDKYAGGQWVPLGFMCMQAAMKVGFTLKSIVVKDINGNEKGKGKNGNLWRYRALAQGYYVFKHEYVFIFQKPKRRGK